MTADAVRIARNNDEHRYELFVGDELASYTEFSGSGVVVLPHTVTLDEFRGRGLADQVVRFALDDIRGRGEKVIPQCPFVQRFISEHAEYGDLVAQA